MGDRALIIITDGKEVSPTIYLHWNGSNVPGYIEQAAARMQGRLGDVSYAAARFVGICHENIEGNLSLGLFETPAKVKRAILSGGRAAALAEFSHGDAGAVLIDANDFSWVAYGGYLSEDPRTTAA